MTSNTFQQYFEQKNMFELIKNVLLPMSHRRAILIVNITIQKLTSRLILSCDRPTASWTWFEIPVRISRRSDWTYTTGNWNYFDQCNIRISSVRVGVKELKYMLCPSLTHKLTTQLQYIAVYCHTIYYKKRAQSSRTV